MMGGQTLEGMFSEPAATRTLGTADAQHDSGISASISGKYQTLHYSCHYTAALGVVVGDLGRLSWSLILAVCLMRRSRRGSGRPKIHPPIRQRWLVRANAELPGLLHDLPFADMHALREVH